MTYVACSVDERHVNPLFEVFDGGDFILSSYRDVEEPQAELRIYLPDPADAPRAAEALAAAGRVVGLDLTPETGDIPDEDWRLAYRKHFTIDVISPRLAIVPEWEAAAFTPAPGQRVLLLDPGMAFGTGRHATTRACLQFIDRLAAENPARTFLDAGCGSGILAIAAKMEGFRDVAGFDIDPDAVENARANARMNGLDIPFVRSDLCGVSPLPDAAAPIRPADVVAANVLGPILIRYAAETARAVRPGGRLILSGILDELYPDVRAAYAPFGFTELDTILIGEWRTGLFAAPEA